VRCCGIGRSEGHCGGGKAVTTTSRGEGGCGGCSSNRIAL